jgi:hypothetical protein
MFVQETNFPSFQQLSQEMKQNKARCRGKTEPLGPISWTFETVSAGKGREEEEEEY